MYSQFKRTFIETFSERRLEMDIEEFIDDIRGERQSWRERNSSVQKWELPDIIRVEERG